ncbi:hypothetical protein K469DRAFT_575039, partial [Zopfia rhizophila CBS 207.26]
LFNDPTISDVATRQIYDSKAVDYHGHRQILCTNTKWFLNASTSPCEEASKCVVGIHDHDPAHFKFMLKCIYGSIYDYE